MTIGMGRPVVIGKGPGDVGSQLVASRNGGGFPARKPARPPGQTPEVEETKMRKLGIVVTAIACLMLAAQVFAATAPAAGAFKGQMDVGAFGGVAVPMGKLADKSTETELGGNMKMGYGGGVFFDYFMTPEIALGLDGSYVTSTNKDDSNVKGNTMQYGIHGKYLIPTGGKFLPYLQVGAAMYNRKADYTSGGASVSASDTKPGINGGVGFGYKVNESVAVGLNGMYHYTIGKFEPEIEGTKVELLKDWNYVGFNAVVTFTIPKAK
jgi:outer membrane protein W